MNKQDVPEKARLESEKLVKELRAKNASSPANSAVTEQSYQRLQRLIERKIISLSR